MQVPLILEAAVTNVFHRLRYLKVSLVESIKTFYKANKMRAAAVAKAATIFTLTCNSNY